VNDFARNLGIDPDLEAACRTIAEGQTATIDVGRANDECFLITASLGVSALTQKVLTPRLKRLLGPLGYVVASLLIWRRLRQLHLTVEHDGHVEKMTVMQAGVINGHSWMGGRCEIPGVSLESGKLAFYAVPPQNNLGYLRIARHVRQGQFFNTPGLVAFSTKEVTLTTKRHYPLVLDGDLSGKSPVTLRVDSAALQVIIGPNFEC
jgi:diacylglycerol kinase family enzyme